MRNREEPDRLAPKTIDNIELDSHFWVAYHKAGSSIETDINRDKLWRLMEPIGLRPVAMGVIDEMWSAMRHRPSEKMMSS